jgi:hypothetical protein
MYRLLTITWLVALPSQVQALTIGYAGGWFPMQPTTHVGIATANGSIGATTLPALIPVEASPGLLNDLTNGTPTLVTFTFNDRGFRTYDRDISIVGGLDLINYRSKITHYTIEPGFVDNIGHQQQVQWWIHGVPEPSTLLLLLVGMIGLNFIRRR